MSATEVKGYGVNALGGMNVLGDLMMLAQSQQHLRAAVMELVETNNGLVTMLTERDRTIWTRLRWLLRGTR